MSLLSEWEFEEMLSRQNPGAEDIKGFAMNALLLQHGLLDEQQFDQLTFNPENPLHQVTLDLLVSNWRQQLDEQLTRAAGLTDSPIERSFLYGLVIAAAIYGLPLAFILDDEGFDGFFCTASPVASPTAPIWVSLQKKFDQYRLDFYLEYHHSRLAVECDGLQHHARSKSMRRDRKKDRALQKVGVDIYRFSGQELNHHPIQCAQEVLLHLTQNGLVWK